MNGEYFRKKISKRQKDLSAFGQLHKETDKTWTKGRWYPWRRSTWSCQNVWQLCNVIIL